MISSLLRDAALSYVTLLSHCDRIYLSRYREVFRILVPEPRFDVRAL
jgi:hypothetical protein